MPADSQLPVSADQLQDKVREVLSRPDYIEAEIEPSGDLAALIAKIISWLLIPIRWLFEMTAGLPDFARWAIVIGLLLVLVAILFHMVWSLYRAVTGADAGRRRRDARFAAEELPQLQPVELERMADEAAVSGDWIQAVRLLFRACLLRLEKQEKRPFRRGTTNRQHLSRYRGTRFFDPLETLVKTIELKWYGDEHCEQSDFDACSHAHASVRSALRGGVHADAS